MFRTLILIFATLIPLANANSIAENTLDAGKVFVQGKPITLLGQGVSVGDKAPNFKVVDNQFSPVTLNDYKNQMLLISTVPSIDTGVCSLQTKYFNEKVAQQFPNVRILVISSDLPFAQKRFCNSENIDKLSILSDSVWKSFGEKYGLIIQDMGLLTSSVLILDKNHTIVYKNLISDLSYEPEYNEIINQLGNL
ncbi:thiol peroxidase [Pseudoalteromonas distincta]|uniref:thiol peroxidase n=1 Tax=Pseudoalteromonas distincta TaxID=77608 RepID=UPI0032E2253E